MTWTIQGSGELPTYQGNKTITGTLTVQGQTLVANGTTSAPSLAFAADLDLGIYRASADTIAIVSTNGGFTSELQFTRAGYITNQDMYLTMPTGGLVMPRILMDAGKQIFFRNAADGNGSVGFTHVALSGIQGLIFSGAAGLRLTNAPAATANYGLLNLGSGAFDGVTAGFFVGSASGTALAINAASGFGGNLLELQVAGVSALRLAAASVGFFGAALATKQVSGANLTNSVTSGGTDDTIADFTNLTVYATDAAAIRNDIYQLARKVKQVNDALRLYGLLT